MIVTLTPNPAIDVTYVIPKLVHGAVHRVQQMRESAGGKGVNVARVLAQLGHNVCCSGFLGGQNGELLEDLLSTSAVDQDWTLVEGETRRTVNVVDETDATIFNERGPMVTNRDWDRLTGAVLEMLTEGDVLTVSGSNPQGTNEESVAVLIRSAVELGAKVIADTSGPALLAVASAGATCLKPNQEELLAATGAADVLAGARQLLALGADAVTVSQGADGMILVTKTGQWRARPSEALVGNPTGAGDAAVAAIAAALAGGATPETLHEHLHEVVALSAAAVLRPVAGEVDEQTYDRMRSEITTEVFENVTD